MSTRNWNKKIESFPVQNFPLGVINITRMFRQNFQGFVNWSMRKASAPISSVICPCVKLRCITTEEFRNIWRSLAVELQHKNCIINLIVSRLSIHRQMWVVTLAGSLALCGRCTKFCLRGKTILASDAFLSELKSSPWWQQRMPLMNQSFSSFASTATRFDTFRKRRQSFDKINWNKKKCMWSAT